MSWLICLVRMPLIIAIASINDNHTDFVVDNDQMKDVLDDENNDENHIVEVALVVEEVVPDVYSLGVVEDN